MNILEFMYNGFCIVTMISTMLTIYELGKNEKIYKTIGIPNGIKIKITIQKIILCSYSLYWIYKKIF